MLSDDARLTHTRADILAASAVALLCATTGEVGAQTPQIDIAAGQIAPQGEAFFAADAGFFKKQGIRVILNVFRSGAANAAAVAGGDMQIGVSTVLQLAQAHAHGLPFVVVAAGAVHDSKYVNAGLVVASTSSITSPRELNGKTVGVSSLNGLDELSIRTLVDRAGGDSSQVKFAELPPSSEVAALLQGRIDAVNMQDPQRQSALDAHQVRTIGIGDDAIGSTFVQTAWFTTTTWLAANKGTAKRFATAIYESGDWAMRNPTSAADVISKYLKTAPVPTTQRYASTMDLHEFQVVLDAAVKYNMLPAVSAASFVWDGT
jgi:NitT/TauT family transport system substrate-binding protein